MGRTVTFPSTGQTLASTAITPQQFQDLMQRVTCDVLGIVSGYPLVFSTVAASATTIGVFYGAPTVSNPPLHPGYLVSGPGIPTGTTLISFVTSFDNTIEIVMSNEATVTASNVTLLFSDPTTNTAVRETWQQQGAPAWGISDDVCFIRCVEENGEYNKPRDQGTIQNDDGSVTVERMYTRLWRVYWGAWGPNCYDNIRVIRSALLLEVTSVPLLVYQLYVMTELSAPVYSPENKDGQWWQRTIFEAQFYEQINESITTQSVESVELITQTASGVAADITVTRTANN